MGKGLHRAERTEIYDVLLSAPKNRNFGIRYNEIP